MPSIDSHPAYRWDPLIATPGGRAAVSWIAVVETTRREGGIDRSKSLPGKSLLDYFVKNGTGIADVNVPAAPLSIVIVEFVITPAITAVLSAYWITR